jgi:hypothetical protein
MENKYGKVFEKDKHPWLSLDVKAFGDMPVDSIPDMDEVHFINVGGVVCLQTDAKTHEGQRVLFKIADKPELMELCKAFKELRLDLNQAEADAARQKREEKNRVAMEKMNAVKIPEGKARIYVEQDGYFDGAPNYHMRTASGLKVPYSISPKEAKIEWVDDEHGVTWANQADVEQIEARKAEEQKEREAWKKKVKETPIPEAALKAYNRYSGNSERAWEAEDEVAYSLIEKWTPYIEAQHGMHPAEVKRFLDEARKEENFGINEG